MGGIFARLLVLFGFCVVVPEVEAGDVVHALAGDLLQIRRQVARTVRLVEADVYGVLAGIVVQRTASDVHALVVHQLEGLRCGDGLRKGAARVGRAHALGAHGHDPVGHELIVLLQAQAEEIRVFARIEVCAVHEFGSARIVGVLAVELHVDLVIHARVRALNEAGGQHDGLEARAGVRLAALGSRGFGGEQVS